MSELAKRLRGEGRKMMGMPGLEDIGADLIAAAEIVERAEWRPIESAPKDGTKILAFASDGIPTVVYYHEPHKPERERWRIHRASGTHLIDPVMFMPLPAPPEVKR